MLQSSSHANSAPLFFFSPHRKQLFIEFTTEKKTNKKKKQSLTQAEFPATSSPLASYVTLTSELCLSSKSQGTKKYIYIYIVIHSYSIYTFQDYKANGQKMKTFLQETIFRKGGGDFSCTQWTFFF